MVVYLSLPVNLFCKSIALRKDCSESGSLERKLEPESTYSKGTDIWIVEGEIFLGVHARKDPQEILELFEELSE